MAWLLSLVASGSDGGAALVVKNSIKSVVTKSQIKMMGGAVFVSVRVQISKFLCRLFKNSI